MAFCANCGNQLNGNELFCSACGTPQKISKVNNHQYSEHRQNVYVGNVRKCPSCGAELSSFTAICPQCGHELNSVKVPESIKDFSNQLSLIDIEIANSPIVKSWKNWSGGAKFGWVVLNLFTFCIPLLIYLLLSVGGFGRFGKLSPIEKKKEAFINNYSFPNDRESVLEALLFIKSQVAILSSAPKNRKTKKWILIWENKAKQLLNKSKLLFQEDTIATDTYNEIEKVKEKVNKSILIKSIIILSIIIVLIAIIIIPRIKYLSGINMVFKTGNSSIDNTIDKSLIPTIGENATTNEKEGIYSIPIRNYLGKNAASIGSKRGNYLMEEYGEGELRVVFVTENGKYLGMDNKEKKNYVVVNQNIPEGTTLTLVCDRTDKGEIFESFISYQSYDEIILYVKAIGQSDYNPSIKTILPTLDRHLYHIRDYTGRNAGSFGEVIGDKRIDRYGSGELRLSFTHEDGSFVESVSADYLKNYIVVKQDIEVNTELMLSYSYIDGKESNFIRSQSIEEITLTIKKLK